MSHQIGLDREEVAAKMAASLEADILAGKIPSGWYIDTREQADQIAARLTEITKELHISTDEGEWTSPQFQIKKMFKVGEPVSFAFNGDCYPSGTIKKISKSLRIIELENGKKFWRFKQSGSWLEGGCWNLVHGHHSAYNREF